MLEAAGIVEVIDDVKKVAPRRRAAHALADDVIGQMDGRAHAPSIDDLEPAAEGSCPW